MDGTIARAVGSLAGEDPLELGGAALEHWTLSCNGYRGAVSADLGCVVDEVLGRVGVVTCLEVVLDEDFVGEIGEDGELFVLVGMGLGGRGATQAVVVAILVARVRKHHGGQNGKQKSGEEHRAEHFFSRRWAMERGRSELRRRRLEAAWKNRRVGMFYSFIERNPRNFAGIKACS